MRGFLTAIAVATLAMPGAAGADTFVWFMGSGSGDLCADPPAFRGTMAPGGDIVSGEWTVTIDGSGWPPASDTSARRQYLNATFFEGNYVVGSPGFWSGYFDTAHGLPGPCELCLEDYTNGGSLSGYCSFQMTMIDHDANAVLDGWDGCAGAITGLITIVGGSGFYDGQDGAGNWWAEYTRECPGSTLQLWDLAMYIWLEEEILPTEQSSWGAIKAPYR